MAKTAEELVKLFEQSITLIKENKIQYLDLNKFYGVYDFHSIDTKHVFELAHALSQNSSLLGFYYTNPSIQDGKALIELANALKNHKSLKFLEFRRVHVFPIDQNGKLDKSEDAEKIIEQAKLALAEVLEHNKILEEVDFTGNELTYYAAAASIGRGLKSNTSLKKLYLSRNSFGPKGASYITDALKDNTTLEELDLSDNLFDNWHGEPLVVYKSILDAFKSNPALALQELDLSENRPNRQCDERPIEDFLRDKKQKLKNPTAMPKISDDFETMLKQLENNEIVKELDLSDKKLSDEQIERLAKILANNRSLDFLRLNNNGLSVRAITAIVNAIKQNTTLRGLDLTDNYLDHTAATLIADLLQDNKKLVTIFLSRCGLSLEDAKLIVLALKFNKTLKHIIFGEDLPFGYGLREPVIETLKENRTLLTVDRFPALGFILCLRSTEQTRAEASNPCKKYLDRNDILADIETTFPSVCLTSRDDHSGEHSELEEKQKKEGSELKLKVEGSVCDVIFDKRAPAGYRSHKKVGRFYPTEHDFQKAVDKYNVFIERINKFYTKYRFRGDDSDRIFHSLMAELELALTSHENEPTDLEKAGGAVPIIQKIMRLRAYLFKNLEPQTLGKIFFRLSELCICYGKLKEQEKLFDEARLSFLYAYTAALHGPQNDITKERAVKALNLWLGNKQEISPKVTRESIEQELAISDINILINLQKRYAGSTCRVFNLVPKDHLKKLLKKDHLYPSPVLMSKAALLHTEPSPLIEFAPPVFKLYHHQSRLGDM